MDMIPVDVDDLRLAARSAGDPSTPGLVLLHTWPQSGCAYEGVVDALGSDHFVLAFDLPGIGGSAGSPASAEKAELADIVLRAAEARWAPARS